MIIGEGNTEQSYNRIKAMQPMYNNASTLQFYLDKTGPHTDTHTQKENGPTRSLFGSPAEEDSSPGSQNGWLLGRERAAGRPPLPGAPVAKSTDQGSRTQRRRDEVISPDETVDRSPQRARRDTSDARDAVCRRPRQMRFETPVTQTLHARPNHHTLHACPDNHTFSSVGRGLFSGPLAF